MGTLEPSRPTAAPTVKQQDGGRAGRPSKDRVLGIVLPVAVAVVAATAWQISAMSAQQTGGSVLIPTFSDFVVGVVDLLGDAAFWQAVGTSESGLVVGFGLAVAVGVPLGLYIGRHGVLDGLVSGYLDVAVVTPTAVFMPLVIVVVGPTFWARVVVIFIFALPFVVVPCRAAAAATPSELVAMARSYGGSKFAVWRQVVLPASVPGIFTGLSQGLAHALTGMIIIELTFLAVGIGRLVQDFQASFDAARVFAVTFLIIGQGVLMIALLRRAQHRLSGHWRIRA